MKTILDDGNRSGIQIVKDVGCVNLAVRQSDGIHNLSPMVEKRTYIDVGGGYEALALTAQSGWHEMIHEGWARTGMEESKNRQQIVVTGTNSSFVRII